jgi:glyoxylase-like metal-dependent hydrolase (beta-lactamase superfamily II)
MSVARTERLPLRVDIQAFHHADTGSLSYLVVDGRTGSCAVIDCVLGFESRTGRTDDRCVAHWVDRINARRLKLQWILETHVHADHLSGAFALKAAAGGRIGIGVGVLDVAQVWQRTGTVPRVGNIAASFDRLLAEGDELKIGSLRLGVLATPGHTPSCVAYLIADAVFVGDTLFMPEAGTARCDFPGGSARTLYRSIRRLLALPPGTRVFCAHHYANEPGGAEQWESTIAQQRRDNVQAHSGITEEEFVAFRERRDSGLPPPALLQCALPFNLSGGRIGLPALAQGQA